MNKIKVLLVEDEPSLSMIVKETLEKRDFDVQCAANGDEGLQRFFKEKPDVVVADIMMPKMDGFTMTQLIRQSDRSVPILFLSAKSKIEDVVEGFEIGGSDYLKKPFGMEELIVRIKALLNRVNENSRISKPIISIGDYTFDTVQQKLIHSSKVETLSHREACILERLCTNQNNILENKTVLLELWGDDSFFNTRSLHVFIVKLRKKLALDPHIQIINIRGIGYKMIF